MLIVIKLFAEDQSELDSPELDSPMSSSSELEEELAVLACQYGCSSNKLMQSCHWSVQKQCGTCFLCHIVCLLPFLPSPSILEVKIEDRVYNVVAFCAGTRLDWGAEECTYGTLRHGVCNRGKKGYSGVTKEPCYRSCYRCAKGAGGKNWPKQKNVPRTLILR